MSVIKSGSSGNVASVNSDGQLEVKSVSESELEFISEKSGQAYTLTSTLATGGADVEIMYLKNTSSTKNMYIDYFVGGASAAGIFTVFQTTSTPGGTTATPKNINTSSGNAADALCYGNAAVTGITAASATDIFFFEGVSAASQFATLDLKGAIILGQNDAIAVTFSVSATVYQTLAFHFKDK